MEVREAVPGDVSRKSPSLMCATFLYYWTKVGLPSPFTVPWNFPECPSVLSQPEAVLGKEIDALL